MRSQDKSSSCSSPRLRQPQVSRCGPGREERNCKNTLGVSGGSEISGAAEPGRRDPGRALFMPDWAGCSPTRSSSSGASAIAEVGSGVQVPPARPCSISARRPCFPA